MANTIPCPNPVCTHDFSLAEVQSAAQLLCPKCGFRMQGLAPAATKPAAPAPKPAAPKPTAPAKPAAAAPANSVPVVAQPITPSAGRKVAQAVAVPVAPKPAVAMPVPPTPNMEIAASAPPLASLPINDGSMPDAAVFDPAGGTGPLVRTPTKPKRKTNWLRVLLIVCAVGFAASVVIVAFVSVLWLFLGSEGFAGLGKLDGDIYTGLLRGQKGESEKIYKLALARKDWTTDNEILARIQAPGANVKAHAAYRHSEYDFWFALAVKDYVMHKPRDAEMLRYAIDMLENYFGDALELDKNAQPAKFGEMPALSLSFRGKLKEVFWPGECTMFFNNGIAYWLFTASPEPSVIVHFADELPKKNIFVLSDRKGWREQPVPTMTFASLNGKVDVTALKDVYEKYPPKDEDENGELLLTGTYRREKDNRKNAQMLIFTQEKKDDLKTAMKAIRDYLDVKEKNNNDKSKIAHAGDEAAPGQADGGELVNIGNRRGRLVDLKLQIDDKPMRYYLLAVVNEPDICYAILSECSWESRQIWRQDFLDVLRTFQVKKTE